MSNPPNRLSSFRSYSYYHVLAMCDSSQTADALSRSTDLNVWEHATPDTRVSDTRSLTSNLGRYSPKKVEGAGKYVVLINGSTDAAFVINQAKWTSATGAAAVPGDRSTSIAVEGSISISEPKGVAFLDQVVKCCVALGVDSAQVVYVLKTFFIGFRDDDQIFSGGGDGDRQDFIADIPPVTFIVYDVTGSFTESGGTYEMLFVAAGHGASRLPQYSKAVNGMSVTAGESLQQTLTKLQDNINDNYDKYYNCVYEQIKATEGDNQPLLRALRKVQYVIEVGPDYQDTNGVKYTVTNQPQQYKNTAGCNDPAQVTFPAHTSIESAISTIMMMSPQVQADMSSGDTSNKVKYEYKIHTALVSEQASDAEEGIMDYKVYYRVERFMSPKTISYNPAFATLQQDDEELKKDPEYEKIKRNIIEFDYMYTGANIDILEFDMKVNMGMAYLQTATLASTFKSQLDTAPNRQMQPATGDVNNHMVRFGAIVQTPVFFGSQIRVPSLINSQNGTQTIQSAYTLNKHASLEVSDVTMRIIGNTLLLGTTNLTTSPKYIIESATRSTEYVPANATQANFADWSHAPAYVKVKIKMPRENDDFSLFTGQSTTGDPRTDPGITDYARDFWFDGYYYVVGIEHIFDSGEFSQVLSMLGLPKRSAFESTKNSATRETEISSGVGKCFDNQIGVSPSTPTDAAPPSNVTVPHTPPSGDTVPTNTADANTANRTSGDPADVKGWDKASPAVKAAIIDASNKYGVDPVVMAQFAAKESSFNANAKAPTSSATGLYQFIKSTWDGLAKQGKIPGVTASTPDSARLDPKLNAYAGAVFLKENAAAIGSNQVGDLYLAHFLGPGTAKKVISRDNATGGKELLITALGESATLRIAKANPSIVKPNTTVGELRAWAAISMAKTLKNPINVARQREVVTQTNSAAQTLPSQNPQDAKRTADQPIAAVQNAKVQAAKTDTQPCGPGPKATQDRPTRGGQ
jgi:Transglycosylase SLT domain